MADSWWDGFIAGSMGAAGLIVLVAILFAWWAARQIVTGGHK